MANPPTPKISASLSISPATHSSQALTLHLTITSHHPGPITIYADDLSPRLMLKCGGFTITDVTTGGAMRQRRSTRCKIPPPSKVAVRINEDLFRTLLPDTTLVLSAPFCSTPLAKDDPNYAAGGGGVNGLERGHRYVLALADNPRVSWDFIRWWEYGTKEQVLRGEKKLDGRAVRFDPGPHEAIIIDSKSVGDVAFQCPE